MRPPEIFYVLGTTATGKTTAARTASQVLKAGFLESDLIYWSINRALKSRYPDRDIGQVVNPETYSNLPTDLKAEADRLKPLFYRAYWPPGKYERIVVEGSECAKMQDRECIKAIIGQGAIERFYFIDLDLDTWIEWVAIKNNNDVNQFRQMREMWASQYELLRGLIKIPPNTIMCKSPQDLLAKIQEYGTLPQGPYQRAGFTDVKWKLLQMSNLFGQEVLDLGCNYGWLGKFAIDLGAKRVVGIDSNAEAVEAAMSLGVVARRQDLDELVVGDEAFDQTIMCATLQYIKDQEELIRKISCVTRKCFTLEGPVATNGQDFMVPPNGPKFGVYPSKEKIESWLEKYFVKFSCLGESVRPDAHSTRLIWKAYMSEGRMWKNRWDNDAREDYRKAIAAVNNEVAFRATGLADAGKLIDTLIWLTKGFLFEKMCILEHGCGAGRMSEHLVSVLKNLHCIDYSEEMLKRFKEREIKPKSINQCSETHFGYNDNTFDIVFSFAVLMHQKKHVSREILIEIGKVLKPGGYALIQLPCYTKGTEAMNHNQVSVWLKQEIVDAAFGARLEVVSIADAGRELGSIIAPEHFEYHIFRKPAA